VAVSAPEAFHLADLVAGLDPGPREEILGRFAAAHAAIEVAGLAAGFAALLDGTSTTEGRMTLASRYFLAHVDCPFLRDEACTIHPDRPLTCRDLNVTSPAEWCSTPGLGVLRRVPTPPLLSGPLARLTAKLTGRPAEFVPLLHALRYAEEHAEIARREWDGMELFAGLREAMRNKPA
jgi:Fe-S-cluster containining protein